jgi:cysteine desulfurase
MKNEIYLDYSATTPIDETVLNCFIETAKNYFGNANSHHSLGERSKRIIEESTNNIKEYFNISETHDVIFTSGASESNNTVIKGLVKDGKTEIITTKLEHSSIYAPIGFKQRDGYTIKFAPLNLDGTVNIEKLLELITDKTLLVTIGAVNSEMGIRQPIEKIGEALKDKDVFFHSDITQCVGKDNINLANVDFASFSGHKIYGFKGVGCLIKRKNIPLKALINGGKSTTIYRSGTPQSELISSFSKSFELFKDSLLKKYVYVNGLNLKIKSHLKKYDNIRITTCINIICTYKLSPLPTKKVIITGTKYNTYSKGFSILIV